MKTYTLVIGLIVALAVVPRASAQAPPQAETVADIIVTGNANVPTSLVLNNLKTRKGKQYSLATVQEDAKRLVGLGAFRDVRMREHRSGNGQIVVEFIVVEHPNLVADVQINGNRHISLNELDTLKRIRKGSPLNYMLNQQAALEIEDLYHSKGYLFAKIHLSEGGRKTDKRVIFEVAEGPMVRIRSIRFTGNETLASSARLKTQINSSQSILRLIGGVYNQALIDNDVHKLEVYYRDNGYLDVRISREMNYTSDFSAVDILFHINEGVRYRVGKISVNGVKNLPQSQVESALKTKTDQIYNGTDVQIDMRRIDESHGWHGYKVNVRPELYYADKGVVHVNYQVIDPAARQAKVSQINIIGNTVTRDRVIRRVLNLYPGQTLRYPELRLAERNLARLNLFETNPQLGIRPTVSVIEDPNNPNSEYKDILVQVQETYTGSFMLGLGVNSDAGLVGNIVLNERNFDLFRPPLTLSDIFEGRAFRGAGQEFRLEASPGTQLQRYSASFREPFLFDRPYSLTVGAYYYDRIFREYTERRIGARASIGHQFNEFWSIVGGMRVENVRVADVPSFAPADYLDAQGDNFLFPPRVAVVRDSRDSFLRPTDGSFIETSVEQVLGDYTYPIVNLEASKYFTVTERRDGSGKQVLAARGQVSWAGDNVPVYDRFFAGGYRSIRGFEFRGVGPFEGDFNLGGAFMLLGSLEYQVPVMANDNLYFVAFVDSGTVERDVQITDYRVSAGVGARIVVPMMGPVPIALDFGFPIVRGPQDREQIFSFYVGITR